MELMHLHDRGPARAVPMTLRYRLLHVAAASPAGSDGSGEPLRLKRHHARSSRGKVHAR